MQPANQIHKKIAHNREQFRAEIRSKSISELFQAKRLKFRGIEKEILLSDENLISNLLETAEFTEIEKLKVSLEELRKRSCEFEKNPSFLKNDRIFLLIPVLIKLLESPDLQYSSCWILINLLIGDTNLIKFCIKSGLLQAFLCIVEKGDASMREQVLIFLLDNKLSSSKRPFGE